jgi:transposase
MARIEKQQKQEGLKEIPDVLWEKIEKLLPKYQHSTRGGRPRTDMRNIINGILYVLRTGCQWKMVPRVYGSGSTCHRYFQEWEKEGVFRRFWKIMVVEYDEKRG